MKKCQQRFHKVQSFFQELQDLKKWGKKKVALDQDIITYLILINKGVMTNYQELSQSEMIQNTKEYRNQLMCNLQDQDLMSQI